LKDGRFQRTSIAETRGSAGLKDHSAMDLDHLFD
jgi:hypothetical protein